MAKKPVSEPKNSHIPDVKGYTTRDLRRGVLTQLDAAMERVWRNCQYPDRVTFSDYYQMYARNNVAARVIETFPDYCWSAIPFAADSGGPKTRFSKSVTSLLTSQYKLQDGVRQSLLTSMKQLDVLGGIGGEALLVFGFADDRGLEEPVKRGMKNTKISWIKVLHNGQFEVEKRNQDNNSPDFGDVVLYRTKAFDTAIDLNFSCQIAPGKSIHADRCVHFKETSGLTYGTSRIQKCYNQLLDITKLSGASAEVYWLGAFSGLSIESQPGAQISDPTYEKLKTATREYFDGLGRALIFEGATAKLLYPAIVSPKDHFDLQITMISIATGIPRRFLTGAEAAKLASQQDTMNWMERVTNRRETFDGPKVVAPVIQRCIDAGVVAAPRDNTFTVTWPRNQSLAMNERSEAARTMTAAMLSYFSSGMADVMNFRDYLLYVCGFSETEAEDLESKINTAGIAKMIENAKSKTATKGAESTDTEKKAVVKKEKTEDEDE